ncbi:MAG TPA: amino acid adenylation domain-containing protein, partial [Blastocatellia bacterium]|nr:amino acid adenylation domain-containing protein [Blastocatellia bacterium]
ARDSILTYGVLNARANALCARLKRFGTRPEVATVLLMNRSLEMPLALLAVMKSGGSYVPLDAATPASRLKSIINDIRPGAILVSSELTAQVEGLGVPTLAADFGWEEEETQAVLPFAVEVDPDTTCYIIYTSGSTGVPKGVAISHRSLACYLSQARDYYQTNRQDRVLQFASLSFDASADEIFIPLVCGATMVIHSDSATTSPADLIEDCRDQMITQLSLPTAYWHLMVTSLSFDQWASASSIRLAIVGGEGAIAERLNDWNRTAGDRITLLNSYGPTETTIVVTFWNVGEDQAHKHDRVPIGRPMPGSYIYVLDIHEQPSAANLTGEICIGGQGLARGYLNDPASTAQKFIPDPFGKYKGGRVYRSGDIGRFAPDGNIECFGRADRQVKVRGFRVELGEVESALSRIAEIKGAVVTTLDDPGGNRKLVAYLTLQPGAIRDQQRVTAALRDFLPSFMLPAHFVFMDDLPTNSAGKIDRRALPHPGDVNIDEGDYVEPATADENTLARIWENALGIARIGVTQNFFELGGDSIVSLRVVAAAKESGLDLSASDALSHATIWEQARLAAVRRQARHTGSRDGGERSALANGVSRTRDSGLYLTPRETFEWPTISQLAPRIANEPDFEFGAIPLTPIQRWFFDQELAEPHHYNQAVILELNGDTSH